jgi:tellurite resistance protein
MSSSTDFAPTLDEPPLLARLSIATFAWVMGIGGLGNSFMAAHKVFGLPVEIGQALVGAAGLCFVGLLIAHGLKLVLHFDAVKEEFQHAIRSSFFPAASVATLVMSIGVRPWSQALASILWCIGAAAHLALAITLIRRWLLHAQDEGVMTPAWFIPVVGNILVPVAGVPLGYVEPSWFFFSIGLVLWIVFFTIALHRVLFFKAMSERSVPTLFILLAPPSIGLLAYFVFNDGRVGPLADILYCVALFMAMLLATMVREITHGPFFMSWWAMTFPLDGWAGACTAYYHARPGMFTGIVAVVALMLATTVVVWVLLKTVTHIRTGRAFRED